MKDNTSKIARSMQVEGDVVSNGDLIVEGELRGSFVGRNLFVGPSGRVMGEIKGETVECAGLLEGRVEAASLKLKKGGCQVGTVVTAELEVESGAVIDCALQSGIVDNTILQSGKGAGKETKKVDLTRCLDAFKEGQRPCCFGIPGSERSELYNSIVALLKKKKPLIQVVGESGSGKTTLIEKLLADSAETYELFHLREKVGSVTTLLKHVAASLGIAGHQECTTQTQLLSQIRMELAKRSEGGRSVILLIDDAEEMFQATMEGVIRLLSGACGEEEVASQEHLHIILFGTGEMKSNMVATILKYFEDETNCQLTLGPLTMKDTSDYLRLGLRLASGGEEAVAGALLSNETIREIHIRSKGTIAAINSIMNNALKKASIRGGNSLSLE